MRVTVWAVPWPYAERAQAIGRARSFVDGCAIAEDHAGGAIDWDASDGVRTAGWVGLAPDGGRGYAVVPDAERGDERTILGRGRLKAATRTGKWPLLPR